MTLLRPDRRTASTKNHPPRLTPLVFIALCACSGVPSQSTTGSQTTPGPSDDSAPLIARDPPGAKITRNFDDPRGMKWQCFDIHPAGHDTSSPVGRCYRWEDTCKASRTHWGRTYQVTECREQDYAACLRGRERSNGNYFATCYTSRQLCNQAHYELKRLSHEVQFISWCEVLN